MNFNRLLAISAIASAFAVPSRANLISNGSFESGTFVPDHVGDNTEVLPSGSTAITGWTVVNDNIAWIGPGNPFGVPTQDGDYFLDLTSYETGAPFGGVEQTIPTIPGGVYQVNFYLGTAAQYGGTAAIDVIVDGNNLGTKSHTTLNGTEWTLENQAFTAAGSSATIRLLGSSGVNAIGLDNVSVELLRVPDNQLPDSGATVGLLSLGLLGVAAIRRK